MDSDEWDSKELLESDEESEECDDAPPTKVLGKMNRPLERIDQEIQSLKNSNNSNSKFKCKLCDLGFLFESSLRKHSLTHEISVIEDIEDEEEHLDGEKLLCKFCLREFLSVNQLKIHEKLHEKSNGAVQCLKCPESFQDAQEVKQHMFDHGKVDEIFKCVKCSEKSFESQKILDIHLRIHFGGVSPYKCEICCREFKFFYLYDKCLKKHSGEKLYQCKYCLVSYNFLSAYRQHLISHKDMVSPYLF